MMVVRALYVVNLCEHCVSFSLCVAMLVCDRLPGCGQWLVGRCMVHRCLEDDSLFLQSVRCVQEDL